MIRRYGREAVEAARAAQATFRRAAGAMAGLRSPSERKRAVGAFLAAREALLAVPAEVRAEAAAVDDAEREAARYEGRNPSGAERLRRWIRGADAESGE